MSKGSTAAWHIFFAAIMPITLADTVFSAESSDFYRGKTVSLVIGYSSGGGYDLYARMLARHMGKHIPGHPNIVPQNMPGAGSIKALDYLINFAPKDGLTFGTFGRSLPLSPLLEGAKYDATKLEWIGSITSDTSACISWRASGIKNLSDAKTKEFVVGGLGKGSDPDLVATVAKNAVGLKIRIVTGYPGSRDLTLAMERGEIAGICGYTLSSIRSNHKEWLAGNKIAFLAQMALKRDKNLPGVPLLSELTKSELTKEAVELVSLSQSIARPFAFPPGTPEERVRMFRKAFMATMSDPEFLSEAEKASLEVNPFDGDEVTGYLKKAYSTRPQVISEAIRLVQY